MKRNKLSDHSSSVVSRSKVVSSFFAVGLLWFKFDCLIPTIEVLFVRSVSDPVYSRSLDDLWIFCKVGLCCFSSEGRSSNSCLNTSSTSKECSNTISLYSEAENSTTLGLDSHETDDCIISECRSVYWIEELTVSESVLSASRTQSSNSSFSGFLQTFSTCICSLVSHPILKQM